MDKVSFPSDSPSHILSQGSSGQYEKENMGQKLLWTKSSGKGGKSGSFYSLFMLSTSQEKLERDGGADAKRKRRLGFMSIVVIVNSSHRF